jgi:hypothetical protein
MPYTRCSSHPGGITSLRTPPLRVVVADGRPLERTLLRYVLEGNGFEVPAEAGTVLDAVRFVEQERPDVVVVHEDLARERDASLLAQLREMAPGTNLVLVTKGGVPDPDLLERVDAAIEEGIGLQDLSAAVWQASRRRHTAKGAILAFPFSRREREPARVRPVRARNRWLERSKGAVAASIVILAMLLARGVLPSSSGPLAAAEDSLHALVEQLPEASPEQAARAARILITQRAVAVAAGLDVSALDQQIRASLLPLLPELPPETAAALVAVLGDLVGEETVPFPEPSPSPAPTTEPQPSPADAPPPEPSPSETPEPSPTEAPSPSETPEPTEPPEPSPSETPSPTPEPSPTEPPEPSPSETPSPTPEPSETPEPSPSETPEPSPSESASESGPPTPTELPTPTDLPTPTEVPPAWGPGGPTPDGALVLVPPGILLLALSSWFARRHSRRR